MDTQAWIDQEDAHMAAMVRRHGYRPFDLESGVKRSPFFFGSVSSVTDPGGNRFDLEFPDGACYFADSGLAAALEVFRKPGLYDAVEAARHVVTTRPVSRVRAAGLATRAARRFGVTLEICTTRHYELPRRWAAALFAAGFRALVGKVSHDPTGTAASVTLLDDAGEHPPFGEDWAYTSQAVCETPVLIGELELAGIEFVAVPDHVDFETT